MNEFPRTLKIITIWLLIGTAMFIAVQWFESRQEQASIVLNDTTIEIHRSRDRHYYWQGEVNGHPVRFLIDTGASITSIPPQIAEAAQLRVIGTTRFNTANGTVNGNIVRGNLSLQGGISITNHAMSVLPDSDDALLGMDVIGKLHLTQSDGVMRFDR